MKLQWKASCLNFRTTSSPVSANPAHQIITSQPPSALLPKLRTFLSGSDSHPANPEAHYRTTGPEIWEQTDGKINTLWQAWARVNHFRHGPFSQEKKSANQSHRRRSLRIGFKTYKETGKLVEATPIWSRESVRKSFRRTYISSTSTM